MAGGRPVHAIQTVMAEKWAETKDTRVRAMVLLGALVLVTRIPFIGPFESDSALVLVGVRQWLRGGPNAIGIYSARTCPLYYATITFLIRTFHIREYSYATLMGALSVAAGVGIVILGYLLGRRVVPRTASASGMVLFALSPGLWWITMEPHPQAISLFFGLLAAFLLVRSLESRRWLPGATAMGSYALALAFKNDALLLAPALLAVALWVKPHWSSAVAAFGVVAAGAVGDLLLLRLIVGSAQNAVSSQTADVQHFLILPNFVAAVKQIVPDVFGLGIVSVLALALVLPGALSQTSERRRLLLLLLLWALPGYVFWFLIQGNNTRHVVAFGLPIFWIGGLRLQGKWLWLCVAVSVLIPGNSGSGIFPSPNVPLSARQAAAKLAYLDKVANELSATGSCFLGSYTDDYIAEDLMRSGATVVSRNGSDWILMSPAKTEVVLRRTYPWTQKKIALGDCRSVEYDASGQKVRFLGDEWHIPPI